ncbi:DUF3307 domain-containing protein [Tropicibacter naphthalenivorans]|uniref:DUF3307 domain-containing protein n=1 Tax=Tropicibacter naphthalenivorans TaxID=441103 RepID=A0A0P1GFT7_9RHOB|nr:DUF3307 domain-containing protein [Tropicibacter naphthalenivorans]CUH80423.1 hypothetical protein TRN7648_02980 [Tropicibacter naphthalenivorans]SMC86257.1 Protein of unknown function [Tropicibacter naphthalenivorans]
MPALDPAIAQSFAALLLAHVLADFVLQTKWMVDHKRTPLVLLLHVTLVFGLSTAALGGIWQVALLVAAAHMVIDAIKTYAPPAQRDTLTAFLLDQAAHLLTLAVAAFWWPGAAAQGIWAAHLPLLTAPALFIAGLITTVTAGGYAVGLLTARFDIQLNGLPDAGRLIGQLERALIFLFVYIGEPTAIGFLIAAKSVLRFDTAKEDQHASEYVIVGTLASFAWALAASYGTLSLLEIASRSH